MAPSARTFVLRKNNTESAAYRRNRICIFYAVGDPAALLFDFFASWGTNALRVQIAAPTIKFFAFLIEGGGFAVVKLGGIMRLYIPVGADTIRPPCAYSHGNRLLCYGCLSVTTCRVRCPHRTAIAAGASPRPTGHSICLPCVKGGVERSETEGLTRTTHIAPHFLFFHFWLGYAKSWRITKNFLFFPTLPIDIVGIMVYS